MTLCLYDTLRGSKEPLEPLQPGVVTMYVCGPTVYSKAHIGHAMSNVVFDVVRRYLEFRGYVVRHVMNYTDVDDKIIHRAEEEGIDPAVLAERYIQEYEQHLKDLRVLPPTVTPRATQEIDHIVAVIQALVERGYAYVADGDVYFRVTRDPDYGKLSHRRLDEMEAGSRVQVDVRKEHPMDFALWKAARPNEPAWDSPWGPGRPGWHIECSAMARYHLGEQIDIHGGGNDLIFPHHENEIAEIESLTGKPFAKYWMHNGMLRLTGEKMSKSLGNLITIEEFLAHHEPDVLRLMVLNSGYRHPLAYSDAVVAQAESALRRLRSAVQPDPYGRRQAALRDVDQLDSQMAETRAGFLRAMDDDFNTAAALGHLFDLVRAIHQAWNSGTSSDALEEAQRMLRELAGVLGLRLERGEPSHPVQEALVALLVDIRAELRREHQWELADRIRARMAELGITLEDTKDGTIWRGE